MNSHIYCVIMAGGAGTRFWPISRSGRPKQFLDILGTGKTFRNRYWPNRSAATPHPASPTPLSG